MKHRFVLIALLVVMALPVSAPVRADMSIGQAAFERGDYEGAFKSWLGLAEAGNPDAQLNIGYLYRAGAGTAQDPVAAFGWFEKAAAQGISDGEVAVGTAYLHGVGVDKDETEAERWLRKAAERGNADGQVHLGMMYVDGRGVGQDFVSAAEWFTRAARQDHSIGQIHLGMLNAEGIGGPPNLIEALKWFAIVSRKADQQADQARQFGSAIVERMTPDDIATAQRRAKEWRRSLTTN